LHTNDGWMIWSDRPIKVPSGIASQTTRCHSAISTLYQQQCAYTNYDGLAFYTPGPCRVASAHGRQTWVWASGEYMCVWAYLNVQVQVWKISGTPGQHTSERSCSGGVWEWTWRPGRYCAQVDVINSTLSLHETHLKIYLLLNKLILAHCQFFYFIKLTNLLTLTVTLRLMHTLYSWVQMVFSLYPYSRSCFLSLSWSPSVAQADLEL
jgi:hypothetical protein